VGPRAFLDTVVKRKIPSLCQELNPTVQMVQDVELVKMLTALYGT